MAVKRPNDTPKLFRETLVRETPVRETLFWALACSALLVLSACEDEVVTQQAPATTTERAERKPAAGTTPTSPGVQMGSATIESGGATWTPSKNWERRKPEPRDPFTGFVDEIRAERARQLALDAEQLEAEEELLLPAQRFDVRDFQLVAIVTNTANPRALFIDPLGQPHQLGQGDLIGSKGGVIVALRRGEIEILQVATDDTAADQAAEAELRVIMRLHPETPPGLRINVR